MKDGKKRFAITSIPFAKNPELTTQSHESNLIFSRSRRPISSMVEIKTRLSNKRLLHKSMELKARSSPKYSQKLLKTKETEKVDKLESNDQNYASQCHVNTINLLKGNIASQSKLKSNYCKRITLSNLQKYYEYCVKKVQEKPFTSTQLKNEQGKLQNSSFINRYNMEKGFYLDSDFLKMEIEGMKPNYLNGIHHQRHEGSQQGKRNYSFYCRKSKSNHQSREKKIQKSMMEEFKLEGWQLNECQDDVGM